MGYTMKNKIIICFFIMFLLLFIIFLSSSYCTSVGSFLENPSSPIVEDPISQFDNVLNFFAKVCYVVAVGIIMIQGVRFIQAAPEGKAKIKEDLTKIFIGAGFATATGTVVDIARGIARDDITNDENAILGKVLGAMNVGCYAAAFVLLMWMGVKWLTTAPDGKAEIKKGIAVAGVGALLLFGARNSINFI